jgi:hypothetical protein
MSNTSDFIIDRGRITTGLVKYQGAGGEVEIPSGVTYIGDAAFKTGFFEGCGSVTSVIIPEGVTMIGKEAFSACYGLENVSLPKGLKVIQRNAFSRCFNLKEVTIPENAMQIGDQAFSFCKALQCVIIMPGLKKIGNLAFAGCEALEYVSLPDSIEEVDGTKVFEGCTFSVSVPQWTPLITKLLDSAKVEKIFTDSFSSVPAKYRPAAALGAVSEKSFDPQSEAGAPVIAYLSKNDDKLCSFAFDHPELLRFLCSQKLIKAKNVDRYSEEAEKRGDVEQKALILNYLDSLGQGELEKVREKKEKAREAYEEALVERSAKRDPAKGIKGLTFVLSGRLPTGGYPPVWESKAELQKYLEGYGAKLASDLSSQADYLVVVEEGSEKSRQAKELGLQELSLDEFNKMVGKRFPNEPHISVHPWMKKLPDYAFFNYSSVIQSVDLPADLTHIGVGVFSLCIQLADIAIPDTVKSIGEQAFLNCQSLTAVSLPPHLTSISNSMLMNCVKLKEVSIPATVTSIGAEAFMNCEALTSLLIPEGVKRIGKDAFKGCKGLADANGLVIVRDVLYDYFGQSGEVVLPEGLTAIGDEVFKGRKELKSIVIPESVTKIGKDTFKGCRKLVIRAAVGSAAEQYAKKNKVAFEAIG